MGELAELLEAGTGEDGGNVGGGYVDLLSCHQRGHAPEDVREVLRLAEEARRESVDLYQFTKLVTEGFSRDQRLRLIEAIWGVVYSDGVLTAVEGQLARRIAELLGFQHPEVQAARERVAARKG